MLHKLVEKLEASAMARYNEKYNNLLYMKATQGKSNAYANALIDEAMTICGSPYYKLSNRRWAQVAIDFLSEFVDKCPLLDYCDTKKIDIEHCPQLKRNVDKCPRLPVSGLPIEGVREMSNRQLTIKGGPPFLHSGGIGPDDYILKPIKGGHWTLVIIRAGRHWQGKEVGRDRARAMYNADIDAMRNMFPIQQVCVPDMARQLARMEKRGNVPTMSMEQFYQEQLGR